METLAECITGYSFATFWHLVLLLCIGIRLQRAPIRTFQLLMAFSIGEVVGIVLAIAVAACYIALGVEFQPRAPFPEMLRVGWPAYMTWASSAPLTFLIVGLRYSLKSNAGNASTGTGRG